MDAQALTRQDVEAPLPPSLLTWIPHLWRRALFPGKAQAITRWKWLPFLTMILLPGCLLYPCLFFPLFEPDESRYAQIPREMLQQGEWVVPTLQGQPYLDKPPLFYWLVMGSYRLFGESGESARLIPALCVHLTLLTVWFFARRWVGDLAAFLGSLLLCIAPGFLTMGRLLLLDGLLTFLVILALFSAYEALRGETLHRGWWTLSAFACGLGTLTKGPVIVILLLPPLLLQGWLLKNLCRPSRRAILTYLLIVIAVPMPWFLTMLIQAPEFARHFLWEHNVMRFVAPFDHQRGVWFYVPILLFGLLPATLWIVPMIRFLLSGESCQAQRRCASLSFLLLAGGWCVFFFTLSGCKLPTYILPAFPSLALACAIFLTRTNRVWHRRTKVVLAMSLAFVVVMNHSLIPWYANYRSPTRQADVLKRYCGDRETKVVCYPRPCNAVAYLLNRSDLRNYRSKQIEELRALVRQNSRTVILCTHRHSLDGLRELLPPEVEITETAHFGLDEVPGLPNRWQEKARKLLGQTALGLCDLAVVEIRPEWRDLLVKKSNRKR